MCHRNSPIHFTTIPVRKSLYWVRDQLLRTMLTTIEGIYENGKVTLTELPPLKKSSKVLVTFMTDTHAVPANDKRKLGTMKGTVKMADNFNDNMGGVSW